MDSGPPTGEQLTTVTHMVVIKLVIGLKLSACGLLASQIVSGRCKEPPQKKQMLVAASRIFALSSI